VQTRDATPGRASQSAILDDILDQVASEANALVINADKTVAPDTSATLDVFPAFGPGRPPGGLVRRGNRGIDSPTYRGRGSNADADGQEDWALLTASASGRSNLPDRRSLGTRRGSGPKGQEPKPRAGAPAKGQAAADTMGTQVLRQTPEPRTPGGGSGNAPTPSASTPTGGSGTKNGVAAEVAAGSGQRRSGPSPSADGNRLTVSSAGGAAAVAGATPSAGSGSGTSRESKMLPPGATTGGRNTPQGGGVAAASQDRRNSGGTGKPKEAPQAVRTSGSRPPGAAPSPKASTPSSKSAARRTSDGEQDRSGALAADPQALNQLLQEHSRALVPSSLPAVPSTFAQLPRAAEQPLVLYLCRLWAEAGLGDKEWAQALHMFDTELNDQLRQTKGGGNSNSEGREARWTLETFSMWLLKRGRRLKECNQWFRAFDFDRDEMVGIADFLQGLVAAGSPRSPAPSLPSGLCTASALFRLLDLDKRQSMDVLQLEGILGDAQVFLGPDFPFSLQQIAQRVTDFEFFRATLLPRFQGVPAFRLRVFGPPPPD